MIAAVYARKSNDQAGAGDKSESVERQLAHARSYAIRKGWTVADAHVYCDDGISGAEFGDRRPGLARLLNALRLECEAFDEGQRVGYRFTARGSYAALLPASLSTPEMVTPAGFEPAISTLKGSRPWPG